MYFPWSEEYFFNDNSLVAFQRKISGAGIVDFNKSWIIECVYA